MGKLLKCFGLLFYKKENCSEIYLPATTDTRFTAPYFGTEMGAESAYYSKADFCCPGMFSFPELEIYMVYFFSHKLCSVVFFEQRLLLTMHLKKK